MAFDLSKPDDRKHLGCILARRRRKLNLTQLALARRAGCTAFPVAFAEKGGRTTYIRAIRLALLKDELANRNARKIKKKIATLRTLWAAIPASPEKAACETAMLDRAWELLDSANAEGCDALLEFMPEAKADALLDEYFEDLK